VTSLSNEWIHEKGYIYCTCIYIQYIVFITNLLYTFTVFNILDKSHLKDHKYTKKDNNRLHLSSTGSPTKRSPTKSNSEFVSKVTIDDVLQYDYDSN
jgi:hypothetical protein